MGRSCYITAILLLVIVINTCTAAINDSYPHLKNISSFFINTTTDEQTNDISSGDQQTPNCSSTLGCQERTTSGSPIKLVAKTDFRKYTEMTGYLIHAEAHYREMIYSGTDETDDGSSRLRPRGSTTADSPVTLVFTGVSLKDTEKIPVRSINAQEMIYYGTDETDDGSSGPKPRVIKQARHPTPLGSTYSGLNGVQNKSSMFLEKLCIEHSCNVTEPPNHKAPKRSKIIKTFSVSKEALLFLKGLLVTRVMPSFYIILFLISLPLNALALVTFTCKIKAKKPAVIFMSHLACVDLLFTLLLPLKIHYRLNGSHWVFGEAACRVVTAAYYCYMYCSILLMMCMSVDRLLAVVLPVASLTWRSPRNSMCVCVLVWMLALAGTVPLLSIQLTIEIENLGITCHDVFVHDPKDQQYVYMFSILSSLFYFLPLVVTLACYSIIIYVLSAKSDRLATTSSTSDKRRRAVIMTIAVVTEFVVCFAATNGILLYHCAILATSDKGGEGDQSYMVYMFVVCVGSTSVFLDPLLYYYGSSQCRGQIRSVWRWRKTERSIITSDTPVLRV